MTPIIVALELDASQTEKIHSLALRDKTKHGARFSYKPEAPASESVFVMPKRFTRSRFGLVKSKANGRKSLARASGQDEARSEIFLQARSESE